jgi:MFS family permease
MVDLRTAARRPVLLTNLASVMITFAMFANMLVTSQQLQLPQGTGYSFGLSATDAGLAMVPAGLAQVLLAPMSGAFLNRWGGKPLLIAGATLMGTFYLGRLAFSETVTQVVVGSTLVGVGTALAFAATPVLIMSAVPITETAAANGLNALLRSVGMAASSAVVAVFLSSHAISDGAASLPSRQTFLLLFAIAGGCAFVGAAVAVAIPSAAPGALLAGRSWLRHGEVRSRRRERVVRGRVLPGGMSPGGLPGIVTVFTTDGVHVDWARIDHDGNYSVVLPGDGRYLVTATARGWAPHAEILEYRGEDSEPRHVVLVDETTLSGRITDHDGPGTGALVVLSAGDSTYHASTRSDESGYYQLPLPPMGPYILSALSADERRAAACKVVVTLQPITVDVSLAE